MLILYSSSLKITKKGFPKIDEWEQSTPVDWVGGLAWDFRVAKLDRCLGKNRGLQWLECCDYNTLDEDISLKRLMYNHKNSSSHKLRQKIKNSIKRKSGKV